MKQAVFLFIPSDEGVLCVTRPLEKAKYPGDFGLPGGMVEEGETLLEAVAREAFEEGIDVEIIHIVPIQSLFFVEKQSEVHWFLGKGKFTEELFKESHRIKQVYKTLEELATSTKGNDLLVQKLKN